MSQMLSTSIPVVDPPTQTEEGPSEYRDKRRTARTAIPASMDIVLDGDPPLIIKADSRVMSCSGATLKLDCNALTYARFSIGQTILLRPTFGGNIPATINALWTTPTGEDGDGSPPLYLMGVCIGDASWVSP